MNKYLILMQLLLLNIIGQNITQCAATIQTSKEATSIDFELIDAARTGNSAKVEELIKQGINNVDAVDENGDTAFIKAARSNDKKIVELLINSGADVNFASPSGLTALINASIYGQEEIVKLLINAHVDVNFTCKHGLTTLMYASEFGHIEIIELLLHAGANINHKNNGESIIDRVQKRGYKEIIKILKDEPTRRDTVIKKWIKEILAKKNSETTSGQLIPDISNIITDFVDIEYTDIPLEYRLAN